jgi:hypothetical protein
MDFLTLFRHAGRHLPVGTAYHPTTVHPSSAPVRQPHCYRPGLRKGPPPHSFSRPLIWMVQPPNVASFQVRSHRRDKRLLTSPCTSVRPSAYMRAPPTGRISVKFGIGNFHKNLSRESAFGENRARTSGTLHSELDTFFCCRRHELAINKRGLRVKWHQAVGIAREK